MNSSFGPWSTALHHIPDPNLRTFWKKRLAMLAALSNCRASPTRWNWIGLVALAALATALPTLRSTALGQGKTPERAQPVANKRSTPASVEYLPAPSPAELKILAAMEMPITLQFMEVPLGDVVQFVRDQTQVNTVVDRVALEEEGVTTDTPVTIHLQGIRLAAGLELLLEQLNLTFVVSSDVLRITTLLGAGSRMITRTYPVGDLCPQDDDYNELVEAVEQTVSPNSWNSVGGAGTVRTVRAAKSLVISQTFHVHGKILQLLRTLREAQRNEKNGGGGEEAVPSKSSANQTQHDIHGVAAEAGKLKAREVFACTTPALQRFSTLTVMPE